MQPFSRKTKEQIADRWYTYFEKPERCSMNEKKAKMLIDFVAGPVPHMTTSTTVDYSKQHVTGGGDRRPSASDILSMLNADDEEQEKWNSVFDTVMQRCKNDQNALDTIRYTFEKRMPIDDICRHMGIVNRTYQYNKRDVLETAFTVAVQEGLLKY